MPIFNGLQYHNLPNLGRDGHINESVVKLHIFVGIFTPMTGGAYFSNGLVKNHQLVKLDHHGLQTGGTQYEQKLPLTRLTIFDGLSCGRNSWIFDQLEKSAPLKKYPPKN